MWKLRLLAIMLSQLGAWSLLSFRSNTRITHHRHKFLLLRTNHATNHDEVHPSKDIPSQQITPAPLGENLVSRRQLVGAVGLLPVAAFHLTDASAMDVAAKNEVTQRIRLMLRIAPTQASVQNRDGYQNKAEEGEIIIGLYEKAAPETVRTFLSYCVSGEFENGEGELERRPSLDTATFWRMEPGESIDAGRVPGLNERRVNGARVLEFAPNRRVYPLGTPSDEDLLINKIKHDRRGLLTKRAGMVGPEFSVTLGPAPRLDGRAVVFGEVLTGGETGGILQDIESIAIYTGRAAAESGPIADAIFQAQNQAMLGTAKAIGDSRAGDLQGKLLRKVEVKGLQRLE